MPVGAAVPFPSLCREWDSFLFSAALISQETTVCANPPNSPVGLAVDSRPDAVCAGCRRCARSQRETLPVMLASDLKTSGRAAIQAATMTMIEREKITNPHQFVPSFPAYM